MAALKRATGRTLSVGNCTASEVEDLRPEPKTAHVDGDRSLAGVQPESHSHFEPLNDRHAVRLGDYAAWRSALCGPYPGHHPRRRAATPRPRRAPRVPT